MITARGSGFAGARRFAARRVRFLVFRSRRIRRRIRKCDRSWIEEFRTGGFGRFAETHVEHGGLVLTALLETNNHSQQKARGLIGQREIQDELFAELDVARADLAGAVTVTGADPIVCSPHRIGDASAAAHAVLGAEMAMLWRDRTGRGQDVTVETRAALFGLMATNFNTTNGVPSNDVMLDPHLFGYCDFYRCADGRYVYIVTTYPHLRDIVCDVLDCPPDQVRMRDAASRWNATELEDAIAARGGTCVMVRTREEWRKHAQGMLLAERPLIQVEKIGDSEPEPFPELPSQGTTPLSGLRVIDNTHVIAGPIAARTMAEYGADVLHISHPRRPDLLAMVVESGLGKRAAWCDLDDPAQRGRFWELLRNADVYASSYNSLERKGFGAEHLAAVRPGIIFTDVHGWGTHGPWRERGSFDQLGVCSSGFAVSEGSMDSPALPPTYLLNDYLGGALAATGTLEALRRRAREGGSYRVHVDLSRISMWVDDLGLFPLDEVTSLPMPSVAEGQDLVRTVEGPYGTTGYLPAAIQLSETKGSFAHGALPLGASPLSWW
ncbi:CoA transferase [Nocardia sp. NPDC050406]|uniref:CoA transferase n=1 Tax=Nocardia sp. NPDC050406 TaxID=3364318 RepID=UPI0037AFCB85